MKLTPEIKDRIDSMTHYDLLYRWRNAPIGQPLFEGESGEYWGKRMKEKRQENPAQAVQDSKDIGWEGVK